MKPGECEPTSRIGIKWDFYTSNSRLCVSKRGRETRFASNLIHNQWHIEYILFCLLFGVFWFISCFDQKNSNEKVMLWLTFYCSAMSQWAGMFTFRNQKTINMIDGIQFAIEAFSFFFLLLLLLLYHILTNWRDAKFIYTAQMRHILFLKIDFHSIFIVHCSIKEQRYKKKYHQ